MKKILKPVFIVLGFVSLGLGLVGVALPVLPTTPFLLLTAFCFAQGSERFHRWFTGTKLYRNHLDDFVKTKSMTVRTKASILTAVSVLLPLAMYFVPYPHARILLAVVLAWHWWYFLFRVKTLRGKPPDDSAPGAGGGGAAGGGVTRSGEAANSGSGAGAAGDAADPGGGDRAGAVADTAGGMTDRRLLRFAAGARKYIFLNVLARWVGLLLGAFVVFTAARLIADAFAVPFGAGPAAALPVLPALGVCAAAAVLRALCEFLASKAAFRASAGVRKKLRAALYDKLLTLGGSGAGGAEAVQVAVEGVDQIENYFGKYLPQLFYGVAAPLTLFVLLAPVSLSAAAVLLVCTPLIPLLILLIMKMARRMMRGQLKSYTSLGDFFLESLRGMTTLKIYDADGRRHEEMNGLAEAFRKSTMRILRMQLNSIVLMDIIAYGGAALGAILAARGFLAGDITLAGAVAIVLLAAEFFIPLRQLGSYFHVAMNGISACERVFQILDAPVPADGEGSLPAGGLAAEAEDLSFTYGEGRAAALSHVSFSAPARGFTGIAGASGSGKSTVARLLSGGLSGRGCEGNIRIGGAELRGVKRSELRQRVCLVTHEDYVFTGTVAENLRMAKPGAAADELAEVLRKARLYDFFAEAEGLDTRIAESGANLSGGQRQRLSLARALLRDADIYIFDEATSNIDPESEETVLAVIRELAGTRNVVMISHRLANLTGADVIYAMEGGRVAEAGTHAELLAANGVYARLFREQRALEAHAAGETAGGGGGQRTDAGSAGNPGGMNGSANNPDNPGGTGGSAGNLDNPGGSAVWA
ncbi:MAG: DUF454 family protein [Peptococcaceae bacterium]|nr:DUF454 family protein [Peptococcaceae bacterium]